MKKYIVILLLLGSYHAASGQILIGLLFGDKLNSDGLAFGLVASPGLAHISDIDGNAKTVLDLGLFFTIKLHKRWLLHPEVCPKVSFGAKNIPPYSTGDAGLDSFYTNGSITRNIRAMTALLTVRYQVAGQFYVEAGLQGNLTTQVKDVFKASVNNNDLYYYKKVKDNYTAIDMGYVTGLIYQLKPGIHSMAVGLRYYGGLTDIMKSAPGVQANRAFTFNVYVPIGSPKAAAKVANPTKQ